MRSLKSITGNSIIHYIFSRYITYIVQFINSLLIAIYLGPVYLGVWGFFNLMVQYFAQINFGISHSVNAILAIERDNKNYTQRVIENSITMVVFLCFFMFILLLVGFYFNIGDKYQFSKYFIPVCIIICISYYNTLFTNIFRIYGKLFEIAINQSIIPIINLICIFSFHKNNLLFFLIYGNVVGVLLSFLIFIMRTPFYLNFDFNFGIIKKIQKKGLYLFIYNASFYLMIIFSRYLISYYYSVIDFGLLTFSFSLANVLTLLFESFSFLIFPKIINRLSKSNDSYFLVKIQSVYVFASHIVIYVAIMMYPFFLHFFPRYSASLLCFRMLSFTTLIYSFSFGYQGLLIAKGQEKKLAIISFIVFILNILLSLTLIKIFHTKFEYVFMSTIFIYLLYVFVLIYFGDKVLGNGNNSLSAVLLKAYPPNFLIPFLLSFFFVLMNFNWLSHFLVIIVFFILNRRTLYIVKKTMSDILNKKDIINI